MGQVIDTAENNMLPFFSIIIPTKDRESYLKRCLDSILMQSFENFEILLVNDGEEFESEIPQIHALDTTLIVLDSGKNGVSNARNAGMHEANGQYLIFLDDDEYFDAEHLNNLFTFYTESKNKNVISKSGTLLIRQDGTSVKEGNFNKKDSLLPQVWKYGASMSDYCFPKGIKDRFNFEYSKSFIEDFVFLNKALTVFPSTFLGHYSVLIEDHETRISYLKFKIPGLSYVNELSAIESAIDFHHIHSSSNLLGWKIPVKKIVASTYVYSKRAAKKGDVISVLRILGRGFLSVIRFTLKRIL